MLSRNLAIRNGLALSLQPCLIAALMGGAHVPTLFAQTPAPAAKAAPAGHPTTYLPNPMPRRAHAYYSLYWGVDSFSVKAVESGELIRFSYRVIEADRARSLNDKAIQPFLVSPQAHAKLVVPSLEKVGQLRQSSTPEAGKVYWMAFSNPGKVVKRGDRVNVVIGQFHADGLVVE